MLKPELSLLKINMSYSKDFWDYIWTLGLGSHFLFGAENPWKKPPPSTVPVFSLNFNIQWKICEALYILFQKAFLYKIKVTGVQLSIAFTLLCEVVMSTFIGSTPQS